MGSNETLTMKNLNNTLDSNTHPWMKNSKSAMKSRYIMLCEIFFFFKSRTFLTSSNVYIISLQQSTQLLELSLHQQVLAQSQ